MTWCNWKGEPTCQHFWSAKLARSRGSLLDWFQCQRERFPPRRCKPHGWHHAAAPRPCRLLPWPTSHPADGEPAAVARGTSLPSAQPAFSSGSALSLTSLPPAKLHCVSCLTGLCLTRDGVRWCPSSPWMQKCAAFAVNTKGTSGATCRGCNTCPTTGWWVSLLWKLGLTAAGEESVQLRGFLFLVVYLFFSFGYLFVLVVIF